MLRVIENKCVLYLLSSKQRGDVEAAVGSPAWSVQPTEPCGPVPSLDTTSLCAGGHSLSAGYHVMQGEHLENARLFRHNVTVVILIVVPTDSL